MTRAIASLALLAFTAFWSAPMRARADFTAQQLADLSFHQHPGAGLPLTAALVDEQGRTVRLGDFFSGKPVIVVLDYLHCKTLCGFVLANLARAVAHVPLDVGKDFNIVAISIDARETPQDARAARAQYLARYAQSGDGSGWHFLTGAENQVQRIADAVGFPYRYDAEVDQFAHPAGFAVAAPDGTIARYILGIDYVPLDLRLALVEAGRGTLSSPVSNLLLLCYCYDPHTGRYGAAIDNAMRLAAGVTVFGILGMIVWLSRSRRM